MGLGHTKNYLEARKVSSCFLLSHSQSTYLDIPNSQIYYIHTTYVVYIILLYGYIHSTLYCYVINGRNLQVQIFFCSEFINKKTMGWQDALHSPEIKWFLLKFLSRQTLQNLLYFYNKKTYVVFFILHFEQLYLFQ